MANELFLTTDEVTQQMLDDYESITGIKLTLADVDREEVIKMKTNAGAISMMRVGLRQAYDDIFPASSSDAGLIKHLATRGLPTQAAASQSMGTIRFTNADDGAVIPVGTQIKYDLDGRVFIAISSGTITGGIADVTFQSLLTGQDQNLDQVNQAFSLLSPITGVDNECENETQFLNGRDIETGAEMLERIQIHDQDDDTGGNLASYERWAKEASSEVTTARSLKNPRGAGTVDTIITAGTTDYAAAVNAGDSVTRLPSVDLVNEVQAYIVTKNPVTDDHQTVAPTESNFNTTVTYDLFDETLRGAVDAAIVKIWKIYVYEALPGDTLHPTDLERLIDGEVGHLISERRVSNFGGGTPEYTVPNDKLLLPNVLTLANF